MAARDLIEKGTYWRVGNGKEIKIWQDKWVLNASSMRPQSAANSEIDQSTVHELIDPETNQWRIDLVRSLFTVESAEKILQLPISCTNKPDKLIWKGTATCLFTVKSAYHFQKELRILDKGQPSISNDRMKLWSVLWKLKIPPADRTFLWKACLEGLPTMLNLYKRKIVDNPKCPICFAEESVIHAIWSCPAAKDVWSMCSKRIQKCAIWKSNFLELFDSFCSEFDKEMVEEIAIVAKRIWSRRNRVIFQSDFQHPKEILMQAQLVLKDLNESNTKMVQVISEERRQTLDWMPPPANIIKANWDIATEKNTGLIGIGIVLRDSAGVVIASSRTSRYLKQDPLLAEAIGALQATIFCLNVGCRSIMLEGDSLQVIHDIPKAMNNLSSYGLVIEDIKEKLLGFSSWSVNHVKREVNHLAHSLARSALTVTDVFINRS